MSILRHTVPLVLLTAALLPASERQLSYTHGSEVLAPGQKEVEVWGTWRSGRSYYYRGFDNRLELEYGVADNVQTAVYLNFSSTNSDPTGLGLVQSDTVSGISWEWKWRMSDPSADAFGSAIYVEPEVSGHDVELELKGILDKRVGDELFAFNATIAPEWELEPDQHHPKLKTELNLGWSHRFAPKWALGLELRNTHQTTYVDNASDDGWKLSNSVFYGGPTLHVAENGFWATMTVMPQLYAPKASDGNTDAHKELLIAERLELRALIGLSF